MNQFGLSSQRMAWNLILATALATTGVFAAIGGVAAAAPTAKVPVPSVQVVQQQNLASRLGGIQDGTSASTTLSGGYTLTASRVGFHLKLGVTLNERFPFCVAIVSAAVYAFGAAIFGLAAAIGFPIYLPFGVVVSPWLAGVISNAMWAGAGITGIVGVFLC